MVFNQGSTVLQIDHIGLNQYIKKEKQLNLADKYDRDGMLV